MTMYQDQRKLPQKVYSRVPSLADLYTETEILESNFIEDLKEELDNINALKDDLKDIELETLNLMNFLGAKTIYC